MKKIIIPELVVKEIIYDYSTNISITDISRKYNLNRVKVRDILKENEVYEKVGNYGIKHNWTKEQVIHIIELYEHHNLSANEIAKKYNCYDTTILSILNKNGINTSRKRDLHNFKKYEVQEDYFDVVNTEEKAYWYGFLLADGHVSKSGRLMLALQEKDKDHLEKFRLSLSSNHPIKRHKTYATYGITIGSSKLINSLRDKGFNHNKSWKYDVKKVLSHVPKTFMNHFVRGYFDGDGCIGIYPQTHYPNKNIYHVSILGLSDLLFYVKNETKINCNVSHDKRTKNTFQLIARSKAEIIKLRKYLYEEANIYMDRKHDIFIGI